MSTLQIRKLQSGAFKHVDSIDGAFFLGRFNFKQEFNKAFLVEAYGAKRRQYSITEIEVFDFGGTAETFTNWTDLINRLVDLGYTGIDTNSIPSGGGVWGSIIGSISSQTDLQNELNTKLDKVTTNDVEKVYIKNADGTQGMKPVSEFGGGGTSPLVDLHWASVSFVALNTWRGWANGSSISAAPSTSYGTGTLPTTLGLLYADTPVIPINGTTQINRITLNVRLDQATRTYQAYIVVADYNINRGNEINAQVLVNQSFTTNLGSSTLVDFTINYHTPLNDKSVIYVFFRQTAGSVYQWFNADLQIY